MMDEQLIDEVSQHGVIFNRQKYYLNGAGGSSSGGGGGGNVPKYETKDEAWQIIALKMHTDVETVKKRWKYLRERYVSQRKQGDPPVYEHLSRPYLEKMKFLDQHIQPRKSYRNVPNFLTSPHSANSSGYSEYNMDSKSNGSMKNMNHFAAQHHYHQQSTDQHAMNALSSAAAAASALENGHVKLETDQVFRDFAAAVASQQLHQISQTHMQQHQQAAVAAAALDSSQSYQNQYRDASGGDMNSNNQCLTDNQNGLGNLPTSPLKSPLSSPANEANVPNGTGQRSNNSAQLSSSSGFNSANADDLDSSVCSNINMKKPRVQLNSHATTQNNDMNSNNHNSSVANSQFTDDTDDDSDDNSVNMLQPPVTTELQGQSPGENLGKSCQATSWNQQQQLRLQQQQQQQQHQQQSMFPSNADFLFQLYQQLPHSQTTPQTHFNKFQTPSAPNSVATQQQQQQNTQRCSEHLLGELVTTELLKMSKERRKTVQRRILEILFFDD